MELGALLQPGCLLPPISTLFPAHLLHVQAYQMLLQVLLLLNEDKDRMILLSLFPQTVRFFSPMHGQL